MAAQAVRTTNVPDVAEAVVLRCVIRRSFVDKQAWADIILRPAAYAARNTKREAVIGTRGWVETLRQ
eukprot:8529723-Alexandrium_andersonii.AAC.1